MKVTKLEIRRKGSYEKDAGQIIGTVTIETPYGTQETCMSATALSKVFAVIKEEIVDRAKKQGQMVNAAIEEAIHSPLLTDAATIGLLEGDIL